MPIHAPHFSHPLHTRLLGAFLSLLLCVALLPSISHAQIQLKLGAATPTLTDTVITPRVQAQLVALAPEGIAPGKPLELGLRIQHEPEWHTYWKNAGDSGLPTQLDWLLPQGMQTGTIDWPTPQQISVSDMLNYGYEGSTLLPVRVDVGSNFHPAPDGTATFELHASWLVCRVECIPEEGQFLLQLPVDVPETQWASDFAAAHALAPAGLPQGNAQFTVLPSEDRLSLRVQGLPRAARGQTLLFYPEAADTFMHAAVLGKDWQQAWDGEVWSAELPLSDMRAGTPETLSFVLGLPPDSSEATHASPAQSWRLTAPVQGSWKAADLATISPALAAALEANQQAANIAPPAPTFSGLWAAIVGGLIGGLLLNLMPCVFPVLAIKVMGFTRHGADLRAQRLHGIAYAVGVIGSFVALGAVLLALRAAGEQLGWGFQLQSPWVVASLAALFTIIGLNLTGMFEFAHVIPDRIANLHARHPLADAFLSGVMAVAIASPCTAPFMGASLGFAVGMPALQALTVFAALGIGMALPYVVVSWMPALVRWLPRPGAWMDTFRKAMAFPMFATVVWLIWVLGQQSGIDGIATLLVLLLCLAAFIWTLTLQGKTRIGLSVLVLALSAWLIHSTGRNVIEPPPTAATQQAGWQAWTPQAQADWLAQGRPVFVDYTAAWCVTCQYNKRTTLSNADVLADFARHNVALLRADWTRRDPTITAALTQLGRSGVPVYVLLAPGRPPIVMTELLRQQEVQEALRSL